MDEIICPGISKMMEMSIRSLLSLSPNLKAKQNKTHAFAVGRLQNLLLSSRATSWNGEELDLVILFMAFEG